MEDQLKYRSGCSSLQFESPLQTLVETFLGEGNELLDMFNRLQMFYESLEQRDSCFKDDEKKKRKTGMMC